MLKELSEDLNSIKQIQSEMKDTLIEIKNNLLGNNRVDEAQNQISDLGHKEAKNNESEQEEKRIEKIDDSVSSLWDNFSIPTFTSQECQNEKKKWKKLEIFLKNNERKLP